MSQLALEFNGPDVRPFDVERLVGLLRRVHDYMRDGQWHTVGEVAAACGGSETGTAAMMRKLRRPAFGGHTINRRRDPEHGDRGLWQYRLEV